MRAFLSLLFTLAITVGLAARPGTAQATWPTTPPAPICGNPQYLTGPATPPPGAIIVAAGSHADPDNRPNWRQTGATFWFAPGVHTFGDEIYGQIIPGDDTTFIGAPGAVIDGQNKNLYAFTSEARNVTIRYLEIRNFGRGMDNNNMGVVNHDAGPGWTIEYNHVHDNDGAGVFIGSGNTIRYNCLQDNGQYGFSAYHEDGVTDVVFDHNEVVGNNRDDWETHVEGCGCTGGGKFWATRGAVITNNWVHHNFGTGLWADFNNVGFRVEGNLIENNDGIGLFYEISYNFLIRDNAFRGNALVDGRRRTDTFPSAAIYISESGGDTRAGTAYTQPEITGNLFEDNWDGIALWENADRYCRPDDVDDTTNMCPFFDPVEPNRFKTQNISIHDNEFRIDKAALDCDARCGRMALFSNYGSHPANSPYLGNVIEEAITFHQNNHWSNNTYIGPWRFMPYDQGNNISFAQWQAGPYQQDAGSTYDDSVGQPAPPSDSAPNLLDVDTAWLEASIGKWQASYGATVTRFTGQAHGGRRSLRVDVNAAEWSVATASSQPFAATAGTRSISIWTKLGAGTAPTTTLSLKWLDAAQNVLDTSAIALSTPTTSWTRTRTTVEAPQGTAMLLVSLSGTADIGTALYFDDIVVGNIENALDADTASLEASIGQWAAWYNASIARADDQGYSGTHSLLISVEASGWGVQIAKYPGFATTPGMKRVSFWAKSGGTGPASSVRLRLRWFNEGTLIQEDLIDRTGLTSQWQQAIADVVAPAGTTQVRTEILGPSGTSTAGSSIYIDDVVITPVQ